MLEKIKEYWIVISSALVAILYFMLRSKNKKLSELRYEKTFDKFNKEVEKLEAKVQQGDKNVETKLESYRNARAKYDALKSKYSSSSK